MIPALLGWCALQTEARHTQNECSTGENSYQEVMNQSQPRKQSTGQDPMQDISCHQTQVHCSASRETTVWTTAWFGEAALLGQLLMRVTKRGANFAQVKRQGACIRSLAAQLTVERHSELLLQFLMSAGIWSTEIVLTHLKTWCRPMPGCSLVLSKSRAVATMARQELHTTYCKRSKLWAT